MDYKRKRSLLNYLRKLDIRILLVFIILILFGLFLFLFQLYRHVDCSQIDFEIISERNQVGEVISFKNKTPNAQTSIWDFGDNTKESKEKDPLHKYEKPGVYTVSLQVNGSCVFQKIIEIKDLGAIIDESRVPKIIAPESVTVGDPVKFYYNYKGEAFSWEWNFGESGQTDNTFEFPAYTYSIPGIKRVTLIINGDVKHMGSVDIYVKPRKLVKTKTDTIHSYEPEKDANLFQLPKGSPQKDPLEEFLRRIPGVPQPNPVQDKIKKANDSIAPNISQYQFELLLLDVAKQVKTQEDFAKYTCGNYDFPVVKNSKKIMPFTQFCEQISNKKIKIEALRLTKDNKNCIKGIDITYKVKKSLIWIYD
ncbi:PKD domain-containing protein [Apibacter muscae]|uniref:PKD domain-containing protein n=1 Tax=Apibacter muscae TaxID=2509004 RepID=A0A563DBY6_9FLAO|nr:PKD domain-containing protein [Apibacter muscae]TWP24068.1 PKD domain-containing protein [Apibacter muscae]TWP27735.1 PKD domain-containing protein [Apibacter muscae]TWP29555.1 PKD domain-containing protein [Apibacter muscae]